MRASLGLRMGQSLTMTPALQQAIRLLQLSSLDLQMEIQQALDGNLMLEAEEAAPLETELPAADIEDEAEAAARADEVHGDRETLAEDLPVDADWSDVCDLDPTPASGAPDEDLQAYLDANLKGERSLYDHLLEQLQLADLNDRDADIGLHLVDAIDADGYLRDWDDLCATLVSRYAVSVDHIEEVLASVQEFDPAGVAARDLRECLLLQLWPMPSRTPGIQAALTLVDLHLPLVARRDPALIARKLKERDAVEELQDGD